MLKSNMPVAAIFMGLEDFIISGLEDAGDSSVGAGRSARQNIIVKARQDIIAGPLDDHPDLDGVAAREQVLLFWSIVPKLSGIWPKDSVLDASEEGELVTEAYAVRKAGATLH